MKTHHGWLFVACIVPAAAAVGLFVYLGQPLFALLPGVAGIGIHWFLSRDDRDDGELADGSYFFGFVLTLVFLTVGLYKLGIESQGGEIELMGFLTDLGAGLSLTVVGLVIRQVRTLSNPARLTVLDAATQQAKQNELTEALHELVRTLQSRPDEAVQREVEEARSRARNSVEVFHQSITASAKRMAGSIEALENAIATATGTMVREGSTLSDSVSHSSQRIEQAASEALKAIEEQRKRAESTLQSNVELWGTSLIAAQKSVAETNRVLEEEYRRGISGFGHTAAAFRELTEKTAAQVEALPNPADRLAGLWDGVRQLETTLTEALTGSIRELSVLRERTEELGNGLVALSGSVDQTSTDIRAGGGELREALLREVRQMNSIIEEYTRLLEGTTKSLAGRR
jgi:hypothetical protein